MKKETYILESFADCLLSVKRSNKDHQSLTGKEAEFRVYLFAWQENTHSFSKLANGERPEKKCFRTVEEIQGG